jgi:hypothetical protein
VKNVTIFGSILMSTALLIGCVDRTERSLTQVQSDLERVLGTALLNGNVGCNGHPIISRSF